MPDPLEKTLDHCIDRLVAGEDWQELAEGQHAEELHSLMDVATGLVLLAGHVTRLDRAGRARIRSRVRSTEGLMRRVLFYRIPFLPPLWLKPEVS
jgi:hypothetical protein